MSKLLTVAPSPHNYGKDTIKSLMYGVIIALIPTLAVSVYFFGIGALIVTLTAVASAMLFEYLISKFILKKEPTLTDGSAIITGLLLAFNVPSSLPIWIIIIGALVAIGIGKMSFGGLGNNPFNPALVGRVFLLISFPAQMTSWPKPVITRFTNWFQPIKEVTQNGETVKMLGADRIDAITGETALGTINNNLGEVIEKVDTITGDTLRHVITAKDIFVGKVEINGEVVKEFERIPDYMEQFVGNIGGSIGEVSAIAIILGLAYMLFRKVITWHIPVSTIGSVFIFTGILHLINPMGFVAPQFHILTGGLLLGAIFMATDYASSPMSVKGQLIFGVGIGVLTVLIRVFGAYPEGISFAILIMNAFVPLINMYFKPKRFGEVIKNG